MKSRTQNKNHSLAAPGSRVWGKDTIRGTIRQDRARERLNLFLDSVTAKLTADKKLTVNHELITKLAEALKRS